MADGQDDSSTSSTLIPKLIICLIAAASAAVVVTIYHCITTGHIRAILRFRFRTPTPPHRTFVLRDHQQSEQPQNSISMENSLAELIPSHKFLKGTGLISEHDGTCAVCLSEFEEGEDLRTLPECMHSFHADCIDMWLYSHSNCPMCRTNAAPSPQMLMHLLNSNVETPPSQPREQRNLPIISTVLSV